MTRLSGKSAYQGNQIIRDQIIRKIRVPGKSASLQMTRLSGKSAYQGKPHISASSSVFRRRSGRHPKARPRDDGNRVRNAGRICFCRRNGETSNSPLAAESNQSQQWISSHYYRCLWNNTHPACGQCRTPPTPLMSMFTDMRKVSAIGLWNKHLFVLAAVGHLSANFEIRGAGSGH